ncbi:MAG: GC-type dockerin domain-anchored protein, partial [Planctomycetota bacterium]
EGPDLLLSPEAFPVFRGGEGTPLGDGSVFEPYRNLLYSQLSTRIGVNHRGDTGVFWPRREDPLDLFAPEIFSMWIATDTGVTLLYDNESTVPGIAASFVDDGWLSVVINDRRPGASLPDLSFKQRIDAPAGSLDAVFTHGEGGFQLVAVEDGPAPGAAGSTFADRGSNREPFSSPDINDLGELVFASQTRMAGISSDTLIRHNILNNISTIEISEGDIIDIDSSPTSVDCAIIAGIQYIADFDGVDSIALGGATSIPRLRHGLSDNGTIAVLASLDTDGDGSSDHESILVSQRIVSGPCLADVNGDGVVTPADFTAWIQAFNAMSAACDQNGDGLCTPQDFTSFILNYNAGCLPTP